MNILFTTSGGRRGSWIVRGEQLAAEMGARAVVNPSEKDIRSSDCVVVVKRASSALVDAVHRAGKPLILDVVDGWAQPAQSQMTYKDAVIWLRRHIAAYKPRGVVHTTSAMKKDAAFDGPDIVLPHHGWRRSVNQIRDSIQTVGYEGAPAYLQEWRRRIENECAKRGWRFVVNPADFASLDLVVAFRGGKYDGAPSRRWKSNVKVANAQITGTPIIAMPEAGSLEFRAGGELFADTAEELRDRMEMLTPQYTRRMMTMRMLAGAQRIEAIAPVYLRWIESVCA